MCCKAPAKRSQHFDATLLGTTCCTRLATLFQYVATSCVLLAQVWKMVKFFGHHFRCCTRLAMFVQHCCAWACVLVWFSVSKHSTYYPAFCNILQQGDQTCATFCAQQCCDMLCWNVGCVWPAPSQHDSTMLWSFVLKCCECLAGA